MDRRQMGDPFLASEGFHTGLHHRTRLHGEVEARVRQEEHQDPRAVDRSGKRPQQMGQRHQGNSRDRGQLSDDRRPGSARREALDMIHPNASGGKRTAADNATIRSVFMIGPDKKVKAMLVYPMSAGRNFDEVLRLLDSLQLNAKHAVATPVNWKPGQDVIIPTSVSDEEAKKKYPQGFKTHKPYLRTVAQPK